MGSSTSSTRRAGGASKAQRSGSHEGTHVFEISGYSLFRERLGERGSVSSAEFAVGGHDWQIQFHRELLKDHAAVLLLLRSKNGDAKVRATFRLSLVDVTGRSPPHTMAKIHEFDPGGKSFSTGFCRFMEWSELEASPYLRDDRLTIECVITILKDARSFLDDVTPFAVADAEVPRPTSRGISGGCCRGTRAPTWFSRSKGRPFPPTSSC